MIMSHQIIKQPNGKYAIWSTIIDDFIYIDLTSEQWIKIQQEEVAKNIKINTMKIINKLKKGEKPYYQFTITYEEAIKKRNSIHSLTNEGVL